ncbi:CLI_3235 family bacteriocin precursor [Paenibacillus sp. FSL M7-0802]|uniref:CLI_3235 family bacteriocin precursor n=1 Tax=Paenibacillus TaxID=44249 RepID=UPI0003F6B14D|nr:MULTISPECIES: CLI_3235 family bacteriocin precursor [Paenibacillus]
MRKLVKRSANVGDTIEAFGCGCSCYCPCSCYCAGSLTRSSNTQRESDGSYRRDNGTGIGNY